MTDRIFSHSGPFTPAHPPPPPPLLPSPSTPNNPEKINILKKWKKTKNISPRNIIILHKYTINDNHMIYGSLYINCNRETFFVILGHFLPFFPPNSPNENIKKMKKMTGDIIILDKYTINHDHGLYCSWDMVRDRCNCYFSFWAIFCYKCLEISSFYTCVPKIMIWWCAVPEIWCMTDIRTDGWTDRKSDI